MALEVEARHSRWSTLATVVGLVLLGVVLWQVKKPLVILALMLGILIFVHELGHYLAARAVGVRVTEFAIGMGPKLVTLMRRGPTVFTIRAVPIGGFVSMAGIQPDEADVEDGLASKSVPARALVFAAGPAMNLILALLILCLGYAVVGTLRETDVFVYRVQPGSPAAVMGMKPEDQILRMRGVPVQNIKQMISVVEAAGTQPAEVVVRRGSQDLVLHVTPRADFSPATGTTNYRLGIEPYGKHFTTGPRLSLAESTRRGWAIFVGLIRELGQLLARPDRLKDNVAGPLGMYQITAKQARHPFLAQLQMMSQLSISLAVLNLLPIPVLDGGHLLLLGIEVVQRRRLTPNTVRAAHFFGFVLIAAIFVLIMVNDVKRLLG